MATVKIGGIAKQQNGFVCVLVHNNEMANHLGWVEGKLIGGETKLQKDEKIFITKTVVR